MRCKNKGVRPAPPASSEETRKRMQAVRRRDTPGELQLRSMLHRKGFRFRVHSTPLKGFRRRADIVFRSARVAVFVDGCFWHGCPDHLTWPRANSGWWKAKIEANRRRDAETNRVLEAADWKVIRIWTHEDLATAADRIANIVAVRQATVRPKPV